MDDYIKKYLAKGYSIFPVKPDKRPFFSWEKYQHKKPTKEELNSWWGKSGKYKKSNIAIVTGKISNLLVVDIDSKEGEREIQKYIPTSIKTPIVQTPSGGYHIYFLNEDKIRNKTRFLTGCDIRAEGGYVVAPPSKNGNGNQYAFIKENALVTVKMPSSLYSLLLSFSSYTSNSNANSKPNCPQVLTKPTGANKYYMEGTRDNDLFHAGNCLIKGGADVEFARQTLGLIANNLGKEFGPNIVKQKIDSVLRRAGQREKNIMQEIREWVLLTDRTFTANECSHELTFANRTQKQAMYMALGRLCEEGIIEKSGDKRGVYRKIDVDINEQEWWKENAVPLKIRFPLDIHKYAKTFPGNIILLEGQKSQGKSSFALEFCRLNWNIYKEKVRYQNIEMSGSELIERFHAYEHEGLTTLGDWQNSVTFIRQTENWWDKIEPNGINIVDYLVEYEKAYLIAKFIFKIHEKLKKGIALILVQRDPFKPYPSGGLSVRNIPRTIISLMHHKAKIEDVKSFHMAHGNPNGLQIYYNHVNWCQFVPQGDWFKEEDEKYSEFLEGITK